VFDEIELPLLTTTEEVVKEYTTPPTSAASLNAIELLPFITIKEDDLEVQITAPLFALL